MKDEHPYRSRTPDESLDDYLLSKFNWLYRRTTIRYAVVTVLASLGVAGAAAVYGLSKRPEVPESCRDEAVILHTPDNVRRVSCFRGSRMDTTRMQHEEHTDVLVRCWCDGHEQRASEK